MPEPYKSLLVHTADMTGTLEKFHGKAIHLETLKLEREAGCLYRQVLLKTSENKIVEFGAIRIYLELFEGEALARVLACRQPLGGILNEFQIPYRSHLNGFLSIKADAHIRNAMKLDGPARLYGRHNRLKTPTGALIAEVLEILPPTQERSM